MGWAIAISRANPAPMGLGHVGWAVQMADGSFLAGATEAFDAGPHWYEGGYIAAGQPNDAWTLGWLKTQADMLAIFANPKLIPAGAGTRYVPASYNWWRGYLVENPNYEAAKSVGDNNRNKGWAFPGNTCLDHVTDVLAAYGVPWQKLGGQPADGMPWKQTHWVPVDWLNNWNVGTRGTL